MSNDAQPTHIQIKRKEEVIREISLSDLTVFRLARELLHGPKPGDRVIVIALKDRPPSG
jgi:hypothetical protein